MGMNNTTTMTTTHKPAKCVRGGSPRDTMYVGKGWKARFICPECGRETWQHLNYLGRRSVVCDGRKFTKQ